MDVELAATLNQVISTLGDKTGGFIKLEKFPWSLRNNDQFTRLYEGGYIIKPRFFDNEVEVSLTSKGRSLFVDNRMILFPKSGEQFNCPICGYNARVVNTDAERSWAEIDCENCSTYALSNDALSGILRENLYLLSGYYRHVVREPMTVQMDGRESVRRHIEETGKKMTRDFQYKCIINFYYHKMSEYGNFMDFEKKPAIAYAKDSDDLYDIAAQVVKMGLASIHDDMITITPEGKKWLDDNRDLYEYTDSKHGRPKTMNDKKYDVFISHANSNKGEYVNGLKEAVQLLGIDVFYDADVISWGDNWKEMILEGTRESEFAVIVISKDFFGREWTEKELEEFLERQNKDGQKIILPLLYKITKRQLIDKYPKLADIQYISADKYSEQEIALFLAKELIKRYQGKRG